MTRLRREHHQLLGNGYRTRPAELDCAFESICETCTFFQTASSSGPPCRPNTTTPAKGQENRVKLFDQLLTRLQEGETS